MAKALVVGGTGPSGPHIVDGLIRHGWDVTVLHGGQHEAEFVEPVEHLHVDPHFEEPLRDALAGRTFELSIATYGRVRIVADVLRGRTGHLVTASARPLAPPEDPRWGPLGPPTHPDESAPACDAPERGSLQHQVWRTERQVLQGHLDGAYTATVLRYPLIYGPHAPANPDWRYVRRILDGRRSLLLADGGQAGPGRGYAANVAHAVLLAAENPTVSGGQTYNVGDLTQYGQAQLVRLIAALLGRDVEVVTVPSHVADAVYRPLGGSVLRQSDLFKIRHELGYRDVVPVHDAVRRSVEWLVSHRPERGGEVERQLGDPFDYDYEDRVADLYRGALAEALRQAGAARPAAHPYRHPRTPGEAWRAPGEDASSG
jgi:nucleoside-diphosphate-sugar epimerase